MLVALFLGLVNTAACAQETTVRVLVDPRYMDYVEFLAAGNVSRVLEHLGRQMPALIPGIADCSTLLATPLAKTKTIDPYTRTRVRMEIFRAQCWAFQLVPPDAAIVPATSQDGITRAMTDALMTFLLDKRATDDEWLKTFRAFPGGDLTCKTPWRCTLTLPDGSDYPDQYLYIDLILAYRDQRFLEVTQAVHGDPRFVYAVQMDVSNPVPKVISLNFTPQTGAD